MSCRPSILAALACLAATPAPAQSGTGQATPAPPPVLSYTILGRLQALTPVDIREIEISESGGITDIFVRLQGDAVATLAELTDSAIGTPMEVLVCGTPMLEMPVDAAVTSGTFYIPDTTALQAEALRAVWHGRATCTDFPPEVFPLAP